VLTAAGIPPGAGWRHPAQSRATAPQSRIARSTVTRLVAQADRLSNEQPVERVAVLPGQIASFLGIPRQDR